jgi:hypothetical protein
MKRKIRLLIVFFVGEWVDREARRLKKKKKDGKREKRSVRW